MIGDPRGGAWSRRLQSLAVRPVPLVKPDRTEGGLPPARRVPRLSVPGLLSRPLADEPVLLALPRAWNEEAQPRAPTRLAEESWTVGSRQTDDRQLAERACALAGFAPKVIHTIDDYDLLLKMVAAGFGVGFAPQMALTQADAERVVIRRP